MKRSRNHTIMNNTPVAVTCRSISVLQINLNRSKLAHDILQTACRDHKIQLVAMSEPNVRRAEKECITDSQCNAAFKITDPNLIVINSSRNTDGFVWIELREVVLYSCYISPNVDTHAFEEYLLRLESSTNTHRKPIIIMGDFNAKAIEWGETKTDSRGEILSEWISKNSLVLNNKGSRPTFARGRSESIIDLTLSTELASLLVQDWRVLEGQSMSDHNYIMFQVATVNPKPLPTTQNLRWKLNLLDKEKFLEEFDRHGETSTAADLTEAIHHACTAAMPKPTSLAGKAPVYWWNNEISDLRKEAIKARRKLTRHREDTPNSEELAQDLRTKRKVLKKAISKSKRDCFNTMLEDINADVWGQGYQIFVKRSKCAPPNPKLPIERIRSIAQKLFPKHDARPIIEEETKEPEVILFSKEELEMAALRMKNRKAPGPDGFPPEIVKMVVNERPDKILKVLNECLKNGEFPTCWKSAKLVLLPKPGKDPELDNSYRPLCLLNCMGKLYEQLLVRRLQDEIKTKGDLADNQYGFREGRSTFDAIKTVIKTARTAKEGTHRTRRICALVLLDVRNAFNSASWELILQDLKERGVSPYLIRVFASYFKERHIIISDGNEEEKMEVTAGVPQGGVAGPTLWNCLYDGVLKLELPVGVSSVGFCDDLGILITAKTEAGIRIRANDALQRIAEWMARMRLDLAPEKTEAILFTGKRIIKDIPLTLQGVSIEWKTEVKYLGVVLDKHLNFGRHLEEASAKTVRKTTALQRLMPNVRGPKASKRRTLASVAMSVLLYGAEVWFPAVKVKKYEDYLLKAQRSMAIRICSAYRTISTEAALVIASLPPATLLAATRYHKSTGTEFDTIEKWQERWEMSSKGSYTRGLIPDIRKWVTRKHGDVDYHLTQFLSGHGCFKHYLNSIKKAEHPLCDHCKQEEDTAEHTFFRCEKWGHIRQQAERRCRQDLTKENTVNSMLKDEESWDAIKHWIQEVLKQKESFEREEEKRL